MRVLNPIYDTVFKYLMEDIEIAKGFISTIIEQEVVELPCTTGTNINQDTNKICPIRNPSPGLCGTY
ncbi:MAG: hypothetical protein B6D64_05995 [Bacteroidetes bacterium 4484_276]|nr:MAG: hypothetical protein B6D64_05995 [Bacteroidetes bacterium 4484_276]OYT13433.1 MAG: hypothetical protein B6I19_05145 [Bacteroidetes bacterium 4572_114]